MIWSVLFVFLNNLFFEVFFVNFFWLSLFFVRCVFGFVEC